MFSAIHSLDTSVLSGPSKTLPISPEMPVHLQHAGFTVQQRSRCQYGTVDLSVGFQEGLTWQIHTHSDQRR